MLRTKDILSIILMILIPILLSGQSTANLTIGGPANIPDSEIILEPSYGTMEKAVNLEVYPMVIKDAQVFDLYFDRVIKGPYQIEIKDSDGYTVEMIYNSKLSLYEAKTSLNLEVQNQLNPGMYYVVLKTETFSEATKILKFGESKMNQTDDPSYSF